MIYLEECLIESRKKYREKSLDESWEEYWREGNSGRTMGDKNQGNLGRSSDCILKKSLKVKIVPVYRQDGATAGVNRFCLQLTMAAEDGFELQAFLKRKRLTNGNGENAICRINNGISPYNLGPLPENYVIISVYVPKPEKQCP